MNRDTVKNLRQDWRADIEKGFGTMTMPRTLAAAALVLFSSGAGATTICRWVDETGRTQFAEVAPERFRKGAVCTDSQRHELSEEQRQAAEEKMVHDKEKARQPAAKPPADGASSAPSPAKAESRRTAKRPTEVVTEATDCTNWWRIYDESVECFGPYRTTRGATKAEAFDKCNVIASPELKCGPRSN